MRLRETGKKKRHEACPCPEQGWRGYADKKDKPPESPIEPGMTDKGSI